MLSIVIPIYNVEQYIEDCLKSIAAQTCKEPMECILIDDCGKDRSIEKCKAFIDSYHGNIDFRILHHDKNRGQAAAKNTGIEAAKGDLIAFVDSDDYCSPQLFETLLKTAKDKLNGNVGIVGCNAFSDKDGVIGDFVWRYDKPIVVAPEEYCERHMLMQVPHAVWGKIYPKGCLSEKSFREGAKNDDVFFHFDLMRTVEENRITTYYIPEKLYYYRLRTNSVCSGNDTKFYLAELTTLEIILNSFPANKKTLKAKIQSKYLHKLIYHVSNACKKNSDDKDALHTLLPKLKAISNCDAAKVLSPKVLCIFFLMKYCPKVYQIVKP